MEWFERILSGRVCLLKGGVLLLVVFCFPAVSFAQTEELPKVQLIDSKIQWLGMDLDASHVTLKYEIPFNGVVEIRLFDPSGKKMWQNYYVNEFGKNNIILKRNKFNAGESYIVVLNYKTD